LTVHALRHGRAGDGTQCLLTELLIPSIFCWKGCILDEV